MLISCQRAVTALSVNPVMLQQIAIGCSDSTVRTFDRRMLSTQATGKFVFFLNLIVYWIIKPRVFKRLEKCYSFGTSILGSVSHITSQKKL